MGANQSSNAGGSDSTRGEGAGKGSGGGTTVCYYEILGIDSQASEDE